MPKSFLELIKKIDVVPYYEEEDEHTKFRQQVYTLISHDGRFKLGYILPIVAVQFKSTKVADVDDTRREIKLVSTLSTVEARDEALNGLAQEWREKELFEGLKGWRNERYTIYGPGHKPYMHIERSFCPMLGVVMYGCHINGYVQNALGEIKLWVPRRSATKPTYPGMLDNTVAGGMGYPYGCLETVIKECYEEAGLNDRFVAKNCQSVGVISYLYQVEKGALTERGFVQPEVEYLYDLNLGTTVPHPVDGESEDFQLMDLDEVTTRLRNGEFKDNCAGIIVDFLMRHGLITPEDEPDYIEIQSRLHRLPPFPIR